MELSKDNKLCGNCAGDHKFLDCPFIEQRITKIEYKQILENQKLREEIKQLSILNIRGQGYYRFTKLIGVENKFDMEQFLMDDETTDNHWNVSWLAVTIQELWSKPTIQKVLRETFEKKK